MEVEEAHKGALDCSDDQVRILVEKAINKRRSKSSKIN